jgi:hypothetical protein
VLTDEEAQVVSGLFQSTEEEIMRIYTEAGEDALAAMIRITITQAAFEAIARTLPLGNVSFENKTDEQGQRLVDRRNRQRLPPLRYHS